MIDALAEAAAEQRRQAGRALLERGVLLAGDPLFAFARKHQEQLASDFRDRLGYSLYVSSDTARLHKQLALAEARPLTSPSRSTSEAKRAIDERRTLDARRCLMICLLGVILERSTMWGGQVPLTELAAEVATEARTLEMTIDYTAAADRHALQDAIAWLGGQGVLTLLSGREGQFGEGLEENVEGYYAINRIRLAGLLADAMRTAGAETVDQLETPLDDPTGRRRAQRLARKLVEDPVLYISDLDPEDRQYFLSPQRTTIERTAADVTGLQIERRREGTALVATRRELTDRPFPAESHRKQFALLLLAELCDLDSRRRLEGQLDQHSELTVAYDNVLGVATDLIVLHQEHWAWAPGDREAVRGVTTSALNLLKDLMLIGRHDHNVFLRPAAFRFRDAEALVSTAQIELDFDS